MSKQTDYEIRLQKAFGLPLERKIYFNGFAISISPSDVVISLELSGEPVVLLNTTHSVAKTFGEILGSVISGFEKDSEYPIPSLQEMEKKVLKANAKSKQTESEDSTSS